MSQYAITDNILRIGHDHYTISHMKNVEVIKPTHFQKWFRQVRLGGLCATAMAVVGVSMGPLFGYITLLGFALGVAYGLWTDYRIELRATFLATDESGDHTVPIYTATNDEQLDTLLQIYLRLKPTLVKRNTV